jgi:hypothetical protein
VPKLLVSYPKMIVKVNISELVFSLGFFMVSGLIFQLVFLYGVSKGTISIFSSEYYFPHIFIKEIIFSHCVFLAPLLNINSLYMHGFISLFSNPVPFLSLSLSLSL